MRKFVLMGVSGCGKTSVGEALAEALPLRFWDGDDLHPQSNIDKMASGTPLTDEDRAPWLERVGQVLGEAEQPGVIGCSALKRSYRNIIREGAGAPVGFIHLSAPKSVLAQRVASRPGHFMPPALLDSQFAALEPLAIDEDGQQVNIDAPFETVVAACAAFIRARI